MFRLVFQLGRRGDHSLAFGLCFLFFGLAILLLVRRVFFGFGEMRFRCVFRRGKVSLVFFAHCLFDVRFGDMLGKSGGLVVTQVGGSVLLFRGLGLVKFARFGIVMRFLFVALSVNRRGNRRFRMLNGGTIARLPLRECFTGKRLKAG